MHEDPVTQRPAIGAVEQLVHSTTAVVIARFVVPVLITVIGYLMSLGITDLRDGQKAAALKIEDIRQSFWNAQGTLANNQGEMNVKIGILGEKVDSLVRRVDRLDSTQPDRSKP